MDIESSTDCLREGLSVASRRCFSERDLLHHLVAPLFQNLGWAGSEIYFEYAKSNQKPDITLIEKNQKLPTLTIEAKAPGRHIYSMASGEVERVIPSALPKRSSPQEQLFAQLRTIERCTPLPYGCLVNDKKIGVFSILRRADDEYLLACIDSFPFSALAEEPDRLEDLALLVSRQSLAINAADESKHLLHSRARRCFESSELSPLETSTASKVRATLPEDADRRFARMTDHVKYTEKPRGSFGEFLKIYSSTKDPVRKLFAFECLRFCFELSKILPDGWRIEFKKGTNITIQVYPDWISPEIKEDTTVGGFLLQLKAGGTRPGHVWYRIPKHVQNLPDTSAKKFVFTVKQGMEDSLKQGGIKAKLDMASSTEYILFLLGRCSQSLESRKLVQHSFSYPDPFAKK